MSLNHERYVAFKSDQPMAELDVGETEIKKKNDVQAIKHKIIVYKN